MRLVPLALLLCALPAACASRFPPEMADDVQAVLAEPDSLVLYSLFPYRNTELLGEREVFHTYQVLGKAALGEDERDRVLDAVLRGMKESDGTATDTFRPRHALRATKGDATVDLVLCYDDRYLTWYLDGKQVGSRATTTEPQDTLDAVLRAHDVKLPDEK